MLRFPHSGLSPQRLDREILTDSKDLIPRSASYRASTGECQLSDMDRHTVAGTGAFQESIGEEYLENNCADDPVKLCDFQLLENRIMKTVDSVYQVSFQIKIPPELCLPRLVRIVSWTVYCGMWHKIAS